MIAWIERASRHLVFYCHPSEFIHAKDQSFPKNMSKWNTREWVPKTCACSKRCWMFFCPTLCAEPLMSSAATHLDVSHPVVIRASAFS